MRTDNDHATLGDVNEVRRLATDLERRLLPLERAPAAAAQSADNTKLAELSQLVLQLERRVVDAERAPAALEQRIRSLEERLAAAKR